LSAGVRLSVVLLGTSACAARPVRLVVVTSPVAQTISLLGDTLYDLPLDGAGGPARVGQLHAAREELARDSSDLKAWIRLGRSTVAMGRLREAVGIYTNVAQVHFTDPRVYRERGEVLLRLRQLDAAIGDLRKAGILAIGKGPILEDSPQASAPGAEAPKALGVTSTQYQSFFLQGIALYCKGDNATAYKVLAEAAAIALTTEDRSQAMLWLFFALRRVGDGNDSKSVLSLVRPAWIGDSHTPEIDLLLAFTGQLSSDTIQARAESLHDEEGALYSYGVAYFLMLQPQRREDAELWLHQVRRGANWATLPYLVAEADLGRLRGIKQSVIR
jgi:tetratricopeptide (TPR) repeat protein